MSKVYKRGRYWWCWGVDQEGERWWRSTKVTTDHPQRTAEAAARRIERELLLGTRQPALSLLEALELLRAHKVRKDVSQATLEIARDKGRALLAAFGATRDVASLRLADMEGYLDRRRRDGVKDHTIAKEVRTLTSALRQARRHELYKGDPHDLWPSELVDFYNPRDRWLPVDEYRRLHLAAYPARREHLTAYVYLGCRYSELFKITAADVDVGRRSVFVRGTKGSPKFRERWVPVAAELWPVIDRRRRARPSGPLFEAWRRQNMRQSLHRWCARAEIEPVSANDLRRTFASWLCNAGVPELTCARLMGHASSSMVRRVYAQLSKAALRDAIDRLPRVSQTLSHDSAAVADSGD